MVDTLPAWFGQHLQNVMLGAFLPFFGSLALFVVVVAILYCLFPRRDPISLGRMWRFVFPPEAYRHGSSRLDYLNFVLNAVVPFGIVMSIFIVSSTRVEVLLLESFGKPELILAGGWTGRIVKFIVIALATDFGGFFQHWLMHKVPFLWHFHRAHHSAEVLTPFTVARAHPLEILEQAVMLPLFPGIAVGFLTYFSGSTLDAVTLSMMAGLLMFRGFMEHFRHSSIWISYGRASRIFYSPAMHQIHHSALPEHFDKNMGDILSIWDGLFGTLYVPKGNEPPPFGLSEDERVERNPHRTIAGFYCEPVRSALGWSRQRARATAP